MNVNKSDNTANTAKPELTRQANDVKKTWTKGISTFFQVKAGATDHQRTHIYSSSTGGIIGKVTGGVAKLAKTIMQNCHIK